MIPKKDILVLIFWPCFSIKLIVAKGEVFRRARKSISSSYIVFGFSSFGPILPLYTVVVIISLHFVFLNGISDADSSDLRFLEYKTMIHEV